jgi:hypothetical protein
LLSKKFLYDATLFANYYVLYQAQLALSKDRIIKKSGLILNFLFIIQIATIIIGFAVDNHINVLIVLASIIIQLITIIVSIFSFFKLSSFLDNVQAIAVEILVLDNVEEARAESLKNDLSSIVFEYPLEIVWRIIQFFKG